ncbi:hypothetical protein SAMN04488548_10912 [Gordonia westfalica]|uniref:Uncharacterized protein n=1 Tax=Gordonia westfalica TaxID=158898 RepID=A0A1H2DNQ4_9ACTN|nr:hypothetical protein SAMN04488548_10912 [Gordonia westfalica]
MTHRRRAATAQSPETRVAGGRGRCGGGGCGSNGQTLVPAEDLEQAQARIAELEVALRRKRLIFDQVCNDRAALNADVNRLSADRLESEATADDVVEKAEQFTAEQVRDAIIEVLDQNAVSLWLPYGDTPHGTVHPEDVGHVARWVVAKLRGES